VSGADVRSRMVSDSVWVVVATSLAQVVTAITGIVIKRLLGPADVAAWALGSSVLGYLALTQLGVLEAILLRGPLLLTRRGEVLRGLVVPGLFWILVIAIPGTVGMVLFALYSGAHNSPRNLLGLALVVPLLVPFQMATVGVTLARARGDFRRVAIATLSNGLAAGLLGVALVYKFGLVGQGIGFGLGLLGQLAIYSVYWKTAVRWRARLSPRLWRTARAMIGYGFPFQSGSAILSIRQAIDTVLAVMYLGPVSGGVYALASSFRSYLVALPTAFGTVLFRSLRTHHGGRKTDTQRQPAEWWLTALAVNFLTMVLPGALVMSFLGPPLVGWFLPRFVGAPLLVSIIPLAASTRMLETVPLQRLLAVAATRPFRRTAIVGLVSSVLGTVPGLAMKSVVVVLVGVAIGNVATFAFAMVQALGRTPLTGTQRIRAGAWCAAGVTAIALVAGAGWAVQGIEWARAEFVPTAAVVVGLGLTSFASGAVRARRMSKPHSG
jgi:O-antigen/teichoic acid export membrane protein